MLREIQKILDVNSPCMKPPMNKRLFKSNQGILFFKPARKARVRACALWALGLLLAGGTPTVGGGKTF